MEWTPTREGTQVRHPRGASPAVAMAFYEEQERCDIREHLPRIAEMAAGRVLELGTRGGASTSALLVGVEANCGSVLSVDIDPACGEVFKGHPQWRFMAEDSLAVAPILARLGGEPNLVLIDTDHTYDRTLRELEAWGSFVTPGGCIVLHDSESCEGVRHAIADYAAGRRCVVESYPGSNGLMVIRQVERQKA